VLSINGDATIEVVQILTSWQFLCCG